MQPGSTPEVMPSFVVSVPSTGRSGLQPAARRSAEALDRGFSTLYGSKWVATACSSHTRHHSQFQYPLRVEVGCNEVEIWTLLKCYLVSVPSTGRSGLQPGRLVGWISCYSGFSTLYGSKWVATGARDAHRVQTVRFQYPLRVEVGCNRCSQCLSSQALWFQYPLRVEVGCNLSECAGSPCRGAVSVPSTGRSGLQLSAKPLGSKNLRRFSTLYGSKWVATKFISCQEVKSKSFSTLYGSKWVATRG